LAKPRAEFTISKVIDRDTFKVEEKIYAFGERTPGRRHIKPGNYICFYSAGKGVVAHAQIASQPEHKKHPRVRHSERYPWVFSVKNVHVYLENPVVIDAALRSKLDAFKKVIQIKHGLGLFKPLAK